MFTTALLHLAILAFGAQDLTAQTALPNAIWLESLDLSKMQQDYDRPQVGKSIEKKPLTLGGLVYPHGVGSHANAVLKIDLKRVATRFVSEVGLDDERKGQGSITFVFTVDGKQVATTGVMRGGDAPKLVDLDLRGKRELLIEVGDADGDISNDHADFAGALLYLVPGAKDKPVAVALRVEPPPKIAPVDALPKPAIHGPRVVDCTPGRPFLFLVPATGAPPLSYSAKGLPAGLSLDPSSGIITGAVEKAGTYLVALSVKSPKGTGRRDLTIVCGKDKLSRTPPMGWNSWYVWFGDVSDKRMREAADGLVKMGLAAHGYNYVNIDDCWEAGRDENGEIQSNGRFPDMKAMADYIHSKGLLFGIYSSPGPTTCGGYTAMWQHEVQDINTYARWGADFFKYDWCSYGNIAKDGSLAELMKPYELGRQALDQCGRDMVYSLCQYGMGDVWKWGRQIGANMWRTTGDMQDLWGPMTAIGFAQDGHEKYAGPGGWNDPDMIQVGMLGGGKLRPTRLNQHEQLTQFTLWALIAAPLFISCDVARLTPWDLALLCNDEVIDVNQDPLGKAAGCRSRDGECDVWARPLSDGTMAVGLFNRGRIRARVTARFSDLGLTGSQPVRDLWQHRDLGTFTGSFSASVAAHSVVLVKIGRPGTK